MKRFTKLSMAILAVVGAALLIGTLGVAHPSVTESNIVNGQVFNISEVPGEVVLTFNEEIDPHRSVIYVVRLQGRRIVDNSDLFVEGNVMKIGMNALDEGVYQIRWIAITPDDAGFSESTITFAVHF